MQPVAKGKSLAKAQLILDVAGESPESLQAYFQVEQAFYDSIAHLASGPRCVRKSGLNEHGEPEWCFVIARGPFAASMVHEAIDKVMDEMDAA